MSPARTLRCMVSPRVQAYDITAAE